ncbi:hypothetical protein HPB52_010880 [Rhipicephalus sanguineus]|uniref:Uncharacterized protein n=1 Tax=Rhipicephalus sanguineus TaxID=34632 RepID=A0A9D4PGK1_RHISA|nr:hypothetical protein HPB52_010880 [Rhipicephalus sanguineus]
MLVYIEYVIDSTTDVVEHTAVKDFAPENIADFDPTVLHHVWWNGDQDTAGGYYEARVLHMVQAPQELRRARNAVQEKEEQELLSEIENVVPSAHNCTRCASGCSMPAEQRLLREEVAELSEKVAQLRALNARL